MSELQTVNNVSVSHDIQEKVLVEGDLSKLNAKERLSYLNEICQRLGLNPLTRPFEYIDLQGKLTLYARKDASEQLRKVNNVALEIMESKEIGDVYIARARATLPSGRSDESIGAVSIFKEEGEWVKSQNGKKYFNGTGKYTKLRSDDYANAVMKAETKAKRRVTLSICGLGFVDESELETIKNVTPISEGVLEINNEKTSNLLTKEVIDIKYSEFCNKITSSQDLDSLKSNYEEAKKFANSVKRKDFVELFAQYKDAKKDDLLKIHALTNPVIHPDELDQFRDNAELYK